MTGAAFAQVPDGLSFGSWGRADFVPVQGVFQKDVDPVFLTGIGSGWGPAYMGFNIRFSAADGRIGGGADISRGSSGPSNGDEINIWAKPFGSNILEIKIGQTRDGRFRGPGTDGNFQGFVGGPGADGDAVFNRFEPDAGALFVSQPVTGFSVFAQLKTPKISLTGIKPELTDAVESQYVWKSIQAGIAYDIPNIGLARAQWVGNTMDVTPGKAAGFTFNPDTFDGTVTTPDPSKKEDQAGWKYNKAGDNTANPARIEAAFKLKAVEGLNLDIGVKFPIAVKDEVGGTDVTYQDNFQVNAAGDFKTGDFGITYGLYTAFGGGTEWDISGSERAKNSATVNVILVPSFYIAALDAKIGADLGLKVKGESTDTTGTGKKDDSVTFGFGAWIERSLGKGLIKTGLAYQLPTSKGDDSDQPSYFSWPIILEISF